jgi:hypothetical protein
MSRRRPGGPLHPCLPLGRRLFLGPCGESATATEEAQDSGRPGSAQEPDSALDYTKYGTVRICDKHAALENLRTIAWWDRGGVCRDR